MGIVIVRVAWLLVMLECRYMKDVSEVPRSDNRTRYIHRKIGRPYHRSTNPPPTTQRTTVISIDRIWSISQRHPSHFNLRTLQGAMLLVRHGHQTSTHSTQYD